MADSRLYMFWLLVTGMFVFAMVYSWFVAVIVRKALPSELAWIFLGLSFYTGINAFIRSGQTVMDLETLIVVQRGVIFVVAASSCVAVVMLGIQYNGAVSSQLPLRQQVAMLGKALGGGRVKRDEFEA
jgi:hypothetical protein